MKLSLPLLSLLALAVASPITPPAPQCVAIAGNPCDSLDSGGPLQCCGGYQCQLVRILALAEIVSWHGKADFCEDIRDEIGRLVLAYCRSKGCLFSADG